MAVVELTVTRSLAIDAIGEALARPRAGRGNFFSELRNAFRRKLALRLEALGVAVLPELGIGPTNFRKAPAGVELGAMTRPYGRADLAFCQGYGHDDYSLTALADPRGSHLLPAVRTLQGSPSFCIGNILCGVANFPLELRVTLETGVDLVGYCHDASKRKRKSYVCLFGVQIAGELARAAAGVLPCMCDGSDLDEITLTAAYQYPPVYICRRCGKLHTCSCFEGQFDVAHDLVRQSRSDPCVASAIQGLTVRPGICSLCTGAVPPQMYGSSMYFSGFMQSYYPYFVLFSKRMNKADTAGDTKTKKEIENYVRERFGFPMIGDRWISETMLFRVVQRLFSPLEVLHRYRGKELQGLELDIWVPALRLGIEYQGEQHYKEIKAWGGLDGLKIRKANDARKRQLCAEAGYNLVEFVHSEKLSEEAVARKLQRFMSREHGSTLPGKRA